MFSKAHTSVVVAEFLGTFMLALAVLTVSKSSLNLPFFISLTAGLVVASMMLLFGRISGAQLNPAITLGLLSIKRVTLPRAVTYIVSQLFGGYIAYYLFAYFTGQRWHNTGQFHIKFLLAEFIGTFLFSMAWAAVVTMKLEFAKAAALVGIVLLVALLTVSSVGTVMLNPAVALGARSFVWGTSLLGPIIGALIGMQAYKYLFAPEINQVKESVNDNLRVKTPSPQVQRQKRVN